MAAITELYIERKPEANEEVSLLEILAVLLQRKRLIAVVTTITMTATAVFVLLMPPSYTAEAVILPAPQDQSAQALMMGSFAGLNSLGGLASAGLSSSFLRSPVDMYIGVLKSRTIADALIARYHLDSVYRERDLTSARKALARHTDINNGRDMLIHIRVDDHDPSRASALANAYVEELQHRNSALTLTAAGARRHFFEQQLVEEKNALAGAEMALKTQQQASGLVLPQGQAEALIRSIATLRAEIAARKVQLEAMQAYATQQNPQRQLLEREISALQGELAQAERGTPQGTALPARGLPGAALEYVRRLREVKYHEVLFEILSKQYEAARIDEARLAPAIQLIDAAVAPDQRSWPPRTLFILGAGILAAICSCAGVLVGSRRAVR